MNAAKDTPMNVQLKKVVLALVLVAGVVAEAAAATPVPSGRWSFVYEDPKGRPDRPIRVYTFRARKCDSKCPILFLLSGEKRNAYDYLSFWDTTAERNNLILVAPEFSKDRWPKAAAYNLGDVAEQKASREKWAYSAIEHIFDEIRDGQKDYMIFGHSAGAQFVQRMALLRPDNRASVMVAANPGWFLMPEWRKDKAPNPYPYSLVESPAGDADLRQALSKKVFLLVGENDNEPDAENLNQSAGAKKQGESRVDRGENFYKAATAAAQELGVKLGWQLIEVPDTAQDANAMSRAAADALFGKNAR
jgi:poly(3-hydroxybutyrate) depolymerase